MSLTPEEREELTNLYADLAYGTAFGTKESADKEMLDSAIWAALCHTTGRCGQAIDQAYPGTSQARIYKLLMKALRG